MKSGGTFSLSDRMQRYEQAQSTFLTRRLPAIIRIDGRAFHGLTRQLCGRGYDLEFARSMQLVMQEVADDIQGCILAYCQADEISFCMTDYRTIATDAWFGYKTQKLVSLSAARASAVMTIKLGRVVTFDSRAFTLPIDEVCNYFIWRQQDATRNAIQMLGQQHFSPKQLHKKSCGDIQEMLMTEKGVNFNDCPTTQKRGSCYASEGGIDENVPIFSQDRAYVEHLVYCRED